MVPGAKHNLSRKLRARPYAPAEARRAVVALALPEPTRETLALVVSELVTNSILHAGLTAEDTVDLHVDNGGPRVMVTVRDCGPGFTPPVPSADPLSVGGQGLVIAAALSDSWGVDCDKNGCTVWCEIAIQEHPTAASGARSLPATSGSLALEVARAEREEYLELGAEA